MQQVNHKLTVGYLKQIFLETRRARLEDASKNKQLDSAYQFLSELLNLSHLQCTLFAIIFKYSTDGDLEKISTQRLMSFLDVNLDHFFDIKTDLELLIQRGLIKQRKEDRTDNLFNSSFFVNQKLLDMIFENQEIDFEKLYGNGYNFIQFCGHMYRISNRRLLDHLSREELLAKVEEHENLNQNLSEIKTLKSLELETIDRLIMYYMIHQYSIGEMFIGAYSMCFDIMSPKRVRSYIKSVRENKTQIQTAGLVIATDDLELKLTTKAKDLLSIKSTELDEDNMDKSVLETTHQVIRYDAIPEKKLFFNKKLQMELSILQTLLQKDNFKMYQNEMRKRGNKSTGISILLYGPSGTGKSSIAEQIIRHCRLSLMHVNLSALRDKYYGVSEKNIQKLFIQYEEINRKLDNQCVLLLNECDAVLGKRNTNYDDRHDITETTMTNILLQQFERNNGIIISITNNVEVLDRAFLRRFTIKLHVDKPDVKAVKSILKSKMDFLNDYEVDLIASQYCLTGGQIENISTKCLISSIITKSNPTVSEILDFCKEDKINRNPWKVKF